MITIYIDQEAQDLLDDTEAGYPEAPKKEDITVEFIGVTLTCV